MAWNLPEGLCKLAVGDNSFICVRPPEPLTDLAAEDCLTRALTASKPRRPVLIYWDGQVETPAGPSWVHFGHGALDPLLARQFDLSPCVAIHEKTLARLTTRGGGDDLDMAEAVAVLARSPGVASVWCDGLAGQISLERRPRAGLDTPATYAERVSLAVIVESPDTDPEAFFQALQGQVLVAPLDVLVITVGHNSAATKRLARSLETNLGSDRRLSVRRYSLQGPLAPHYLVNVAMALAASERVVVADARCVPSSPNVIQRLADWASSGDAAASCPRILSRGALLAAGLSLVRDRSPPLLAVDRDPLLGTASRTAAAPAPWFFCARRADWLAAGGLHPPAEASVLWTSAFAAEQAPKGRTVLLGSETAEWRASEPPDQWDASVPAPSGLQPYAAGALRQDPAKTLVALDPFPDGAPDQGPGAEPLLIALNDPHFETARERILIFADALGASQSIAFVDGLAAARTRGETAVCVIEEATFPGDSLALDETSADDLVGAHFDRFHPDVVVVSRLGHSAGWKAISTAARSRGVPLVAHIDDDLLNLPAELGIERYRRARNPKRAATLRASLTEADLVIAATPALGSRLSATLGHDRIVPLQAGAAGRPPQVRPPRGDRATLTIGYMGSASHDHDLAMVTPALNRVLEDHAHVEVVLFGSIAEQRSAGELRGRVQRYPRLEGDYAAFRRRLGELAFDIALAPLRDNSFNRLKTPTKWVEYAEAGSAVVASRVQPYLPISEAGAALTARPDEWEATLRRLIADPGLRRRLVVQADKLLTQRFGWDRLEAEVLSALRRVRAGARAA